MLIRPHPNHVQHHICPRRQNTLTPRSGRQKYQKLPIETRKRRAVTHSNGMKLSVAVVRVNPVEVLHQRTQQKAERLRPRCYSCHGSSHIFPATTVTSPWSVVEAKDDRGKVDETSHAQRPLAPFLRPLLPPPELWPLLRLLQQTLSHALSHHRHPSRSRASTTDVTPAAVVGVANPTLFDATPMRAVLTVAAVPSSMFPPVAFRTVIFRGSVR